MFLKVYKNVSQINLFLDKDVCLFRNPFVPPKLAFLNLLVPLPHLLKSFLRQVWKAANYLLCLNPDFLLMVDTRVLLKELARARSPLDLDGLDLLPAERFDLAGDEELRLAICTYFVLAFTLWNRVSCECAFSFAN